MLGALATFWPALAGAAVGIPIIIHLINRRRYKIVPWAAMRFLLAAQKQTRKRMRIEQLLLLLVRTAVIALVLFAMAAVLPWAEGFWAWMGLNRLGTGKALGPRTHHVFVLDASLSMNQKVDDQAAFEIARQMALKKIDDVRSGDGFSVLLLKDNPTWLVGDASMDARKVRREVEAVRPGHGNASVPVAMNMIVAKLNEAGNRFPVQAVYFFTDMQRSTWAAAASELKADAEGKEKNPYLELQKRASTIFVDVGAHGDTNDNCAVVGLEFDPEAARYVTTDVDVPLLAPVANFGAEKKKVRAEVFIARARSDANDPPMQFRAYQTEKGESEHDVEAHSTHVFRFKKIRFSAAGTYVVQVRIGDDALMEDNVRSIVITVRDTVPVLLVNGKASADRFEQATEFLRLALNPFPAGAEPKAFPLRPKRVNALADVKDADLEKYDCIYFCDVGQFGAAELRRVDAHLRRGGGFVVTLGDKALEKLDHYNDLLFKNEQGILPARLIKKITAPAEHNFYLQNSDEDAWREPPLTAFAHEVDRLTLRNARFKSYVLSEVPEGRARTILAFMPETAAVKDAKIDKSLPVNAPAIVEWNPLLPRAQQPAAQKGQERQVARYRGKVVLITTSANMDWNTWPGSPSYGAMMHEITRLAVSGRLREQAGMVGGMLETYLPGGGELNATLYLPDGHPDGKSVTVRTQLVEDTNLFRWPLDYKSTGTDVSGVYRVDTGKGDVPFAVNVPANTDPDRSESNLARVDQHKLNELFPDWKIQVVRNPLEGMIASGPVNADAVAVTMPVGPDLANVALLLVLGLLFAEVLLAWHFGHYTTTETAQSGPGTGNTATFVAAGIAVVTGLLIAFAAAVVINYRMTGDFLGFLPQYLREFIEGAHAQAGESTAWKLEQNSFLFGLPREDWWSAAIVIGAVIMIVLIYRAEAPKVSVVYKMLLGVLRLFVILIVLCFLLPRPSIHFSRQGHPDLVLLIDDTRSMGEPDAYRDKDVMERVKKLSETIRTKLERELPGKIEALETAIASRAAAAQKDLDVQAEVEGLQQRLQYWKKQRDNLNANRWRPSRLQLTQAILAQPEPHWLKSLLAKKRTKVHIFHLDANGRAIKLHDSDGDAGELIDDGDLAKIDRATSAIENLEPVGNDSRLGTSIKQVIDHYRGSPLYSVVMFTDGVTTRDETIAQVADYAAQRAISLWFVGIGDENELRDLKLHDLDVDDEIYLGDRAVFTVRLSGHGYKDLVVPVILKVKTKDGKEKELHREMHKVDPNGRASRIRFSDQPKELGPHEYIIEVEPPKTDPSEKPIPLENLRLTRVVRVIDTKKINVLYVEGQPRYEFRYIKFLMEREVADDKENKKKSIDLTVLLLDADEEWAAKDRQGKGTDKSAISVFPPTLEKLNEYDVLIMGDCDPANKKLVNNLKNIVHYVRGEDKDGKKAKKGGGILFVGGVFHNPHRYKGTPLADVLPVIPLVDQGPADIARVETFNPQLTPAGRMHPIFRFTPDEAENLQILERLTPMFWYSSKFKTNAAAQVLAVHPNEKAGVKNLGADDDRLPLVVEQRVGDGRSMFFGFDETWRWRKEDESKFNNFWIQTMRYLSRGRSTVTRLHLDRQTAYRVGDTIKVTVNFPDAEPGGPAKEGPKADKEAVKVAVEYFPPDKGDKAEPELHTLELAKEDRSWATFEGQWKAGREGKYRFRLSKPDVSALQPDKKQPSAEAVVELPPGELDKLRLNYQELQQAADSTNGKFYTLAKADNLLEDIPVGPTIDIELNVPPTSLWNHYLVFAGVLFLISSEWVLRKFKHLL